MTELIQTAHAPIQVAPTLAPKSSMPDLNGSSLEADRLARGRNAAGNSELAAGINAPTASTFLHASKPAVAAPQPLSSAANQKFLAENDNFAKAAKAPIDNSIKADTSAGAAAEVVRQQTEITAAFRRAPVSGNVPDQAGAKPDFNRPTDALGIASDHKPSSPTPRLATLVDAAASVEAPRGRALESASAPAALNSAPRTSPLAALFNSVGEAPEVVPAQKVRDEKFASVPAPHQVDAKFGSVTELRVAANGNQHANPAIAAAPAQLEDRRSVAMEPVADEAEAVRTRPAPQSYGRTVSMAAGR